MIIGYPKWTRPRSSARSTSYAQHHAGAHLQLLAPAEDHGRPLRRPGPAQEKSAAAGELRGLSEALSRRHRAAKLATVEEVLVDKVADSQVSGYGRDYARWYLSPGAAPAGATVAAQRPRSIRTGWSQPSSRRASRTRTGTASGAEAQRGHQAGQAAPPRSRVRGGPPIRGSRAPVHWRRCSRTW